VQFTERLGLLMQVKTLFSKRESYDISTSWW
jgi:hypothetical protein